MNKYKIVEKFISINGEARAAGELSCFIRFQGCNLNCSYCDTKWANEKEAPYELMSAEEIYGYIKKCGVKNVTLTGGEPLIQENIKELISLLAGDHSLRIEIETNGSVDLFPFLDIEGNVTFTMDYKLPGSHMEKYMALGNMRLLRACDSVKFVVSDLNDLNVSKRIIKEYDLDNRVAVYLSSCFMRIQPKDIVDYMIDNNMNKVKLQLQLHKYIWEPDRKGV